MDRGWWGIYTLVFYPEFSWGTKGFALEFSSEFLWLMTLPSLVVLLSSFTFFTDY
jgi:hypothetical protein